MTSIIYFYALYINKTTNKLILRNYYIDGIIIYVIVIWLSLLQHFSSDIRLTLEWMHSVAEMKIQQAEQDPSPNKIEPLVALVDRLG